MVINHYQRIVKRDYDHRAYKIPTLNLFKNKLKIHLLSDTAMPRRTDDCRRRRDLLLRNLKDRFLQHFIYFSYSCKQLIELIRLII